MTIPTHSTAPSPARAGVLLAFLAAAPGALSGQLGQPLTQASVEPGTPFDSAYHAWDAGDYDDALERLDRILRGPGADALLADVAVLTGERYRTVEVAADGTNPRWSPDGLHAVYDAPGTGAPADAERKTIVVRVENGAVRQVAELAGHGAVFSSDGRSIAWLRIADPAALAREEATIRRTIDVRDRASFIAQRAALDVARARHSRVRVRDLATGRERDVPASEPVHAVVWSGGEAVPWIRGGDVRLSPGGTHLDFDAENGMGVIGVGTNSQRTFPASGSPAFSADGSTLAFVSRDGDLYGLRRVRLVPGSPVTGQPEMLLTTTDPIANPAVSPDGSLVAFQRMGRENQEIWIAGEGEEPRRLTHDVQHDLFPR